MREILSRTPGILPEEGITDLVQDLAMYGKKQHKSVMIAAHSILNFIRVTHLPVGQEGQREVHNPNIVPARYGEQKVSTSVPGAELLDAYERGEI